MKVELTQEDINALKQVLLNVQANMQTMQALMGIYQKLDSVHSVQLPLKVGKKNG